MKHGKCDGQRDGLDKAAERHLDYLDSIVPKGQRKAAVAACFGLLVALDNDRKPGAFERSPEVKEVQRQISLARSLFEERYHELWD